MLFKIIRKVFNTTLREISFVDHYSFFTFLNYYESRPNDKVAEQKKIKKQKQQSSIVSSFIEYASQAILFIFYLAPLHCLWKKCSQPIILLHAESCYFLCFARFSCGQIVSNDCDMKKKFTGHKVTPERQFSIFEKLHQSYNACGRRTEP